MSRSFPLAILAVVGLGPVPAAAQLQGASFQRLPGAVALSHNSVYAITQDSAGFLWFGTADGLNRYDGYEVRVYRHDPPDSTTLSNSLVRALLPDADGRLWVATPGGVSRFDPRTETARRYPLVSATGRATARRALSLHRGVDGSHWVGTDAGLFRYDPVRDSMVHVFPTEADSAGAPSIYGIQDDSRGGLWLLAGTSGSWQLVAIRSGAVTGRFVLHADWQSTHYDDLHVDRTGRIWLSGAGPARLDSLRGVAHPPTGAAPSTAAWATTGTRDGATWIGTADGLIRAGADGAVGPLQVIDQTRSGFLFNFVRAVFEDAAGTLWVGTHGGVYRADPHAKPFRHLASDPLRGPSLSSDAVSAVAERHGELWLGSFGAGLNRLDPAHQTVRQYHHRAGDPSTLPDEVIAAIHTDRNGGLWVAAGSGIGRLDPETGRYRAAPLPTPLTGSRSAITAVGEDRAGHLWLAGRASLLVLNPEAGTTRQFEPPPDSARGSALTESVLVVDDSTIWVGLAPAELWRLDPRTGESQRLPLRNSTGQLLQGEAVWSLHQDPRGILWLGTGIGLLRFEPATGEFRLYDQRDGLPGSVVYAILGGHATELWLSTNRGLSRFDPGAAEPRFRNFGPADGVRNSEFNRHAAARDASGRLYFGGLDGLTSFVPAEIVENPVVPPVVLTRVETASRTGVAAHNPSGLTRLSLSYRDYAISFEFAALSFTNPGQNLYAHRLEGFDPDWVETGTRRYARYTNLRAGDYVLRVRGSNNDGVWNDEGVALAIHVTPPFWLAGWFRGLLLILVLGVAGLAWRVRVARLLAIERLRLRIAGDLHDDLSSNLVGIALLGERLGRVPGMAVEHQGQLARISETARRAVTDLRDIVWLVDPSRDHLSDLVLRLRADAATFFPGGECEVDAPSAARSARLGPGLRRQVYLACKEAIHNAARHAHASKVRVVLREVRGWLVVRIEDNGRGFAMERESSGFGLRNQQRRIDDGGGQLQVTSAAGKGTVVEFRVPLT